MITTHAPLDDPGTIPVTGLPPDTTVERMPLADGGAFEVALVPLQQGAAAADEGAIGELLARTGSWVAAAAPGGDPPVLMPLYGTHVLWTSRRAVAIGPADRLDAMRSAIVDFAEREAELRDIERRIASALDHLDDDAALAFHVDDRALPRRHALAARFVEAVSLRRRLAVLAPVLQRPAPQPPTLAGQLGERLRDRTRVVERLEHAVEQADLLERVYTGCGDRLSEFASSRRHLALEWVIILLLAAEVVLITLDLLANHAP